MDELGRSKERLEKLRAELLVAESELEPLKASWNERTEREVDELAAFAKERGHSWVQREESEEHVRWLLTAGVYGSGFQEGGPHHKADQKVDRLKSKIRWWERKVLKEEHNAKIATYLAQRAGHTKEDE
jgi:hypothetical protein